MDVTDAITGRRSIRKYRDAVPSEDDILFVLEAARHAPSWANTQCWEFILVTDATLKSRLAETLPEKNPARPAIEQAPVVIAACGRKGISGFFKGSAATDKGDWLLFDLALALQNLTLAAFSRGLGTVHVGFFDSARAEAILKVPDSVAVVELLPLGFPDGEGRPTPRKGLDEFVFLNAYGQKRF